jgi:glycerophosphoryl diester phosphodiesterase
MAEIAPTGGSPAGRPPVILFAHRGAMALAPENTIAAFLLAITLGATGLESDVHVAADGTPMLVHDPVVDTPTGRVVVSRSSVDELSDLAIPTLAALYAACGTSRPLSLDLNDARAVDAAEAVIRCAETAGPPAIAGLLLCHEDEEVLIEIRRRAPEVALVHSTDGELLPDIGAHARHLAVQGVDVLNLHQADWAATGDAAGAISAVHRAGCRAFAWDTQDIETASAMLAAGIDGVYANDPRVLRAAIEGS